MMLSKILNSMAAGHKFSIFISVRFISSVPVLHGIKWNSAECKSSDFQYLHSPQLPGISEVNCFVYYHAPYYKKEMYPGFS